jgi:hypothetical protein
MSEVQDANERFNRLWDEIGAARVVIGDEGKGVEIVVDADLSIFNLIEKVKEAAREDAEKGALNEQERKSLAQAMDEAQRLLEGKVHEPLRTRIGALLTGRWNPLHRR